MANPPKYIYQRRGGPLVTWNRLRPPAQTRGADAKSLGSLGDTDVFDHARRLPRGGAPEYIADGFSGLGETYDHYENPNPLAGCACDGTKTRSGMGGMGRKISTREAVRLEVPTSKATFSAGVSGDEEPPVSKRMVGGALATFHGYRRSESIGWALLWGALGTAFPITTNVVALAQGFGKKK